MGTARPPAKEKALTLSFYQREDVVQIARELIGKVLLTDIGGHFTGGIITEAEAYGGAQDRACHAFGNRRTERTEVMFHDGGAAYVYLCYGIHFLLNVVTHTAGTPHAVLIRALEPIYGIEIMQKRRGRKDNLCNGPGALCQALGITRKLNGHIFTKAPLWIEDRGYLFKNIETGPRIGVDYAKEDALLPWRFFVKNPAAELPL